MYHRNNCKYNFHVIRNSWSTIIAKIVKIENVIEGKKIIGKYPYYSNIKVYAEFYKVIDNEIDKAFRLCTIENFIEMNLLSCPGTFAYSQID